MTLNKNGKVIFATHLEKIDKLPHWTIIKHSIPDLLFPPLEPQRKFPPVNLTCLNFWFPLPLYKGEIINGYIIRA